MLQSIRTKTKALLMAGLMVLAMFTTATATELHDAARDGDIAKIERLLDAGANPNARVESGFTALQIAALSGHADAITALLDAGADTNARVEKNITPLHAAAILGHADAIIALLNGGANINARDKKESATPLHLATYFNGNPKVINLLIKKGASITARAQHGNTPLHNAAFRGYLDAITILLDAGADPDAKLILGYIPLHQAVNGGHADAIILLLDAGADPTLKVMGFATAFDLITEDSPIHGTDAYWRLHDAAYN